METEPRKPTETGYGYVPPAHVSMPVDEALAARAINRASRRPFWGRTLSNEESAALLGYLTESVRSRMAAEIAREFRLAAAPELNAENLKGYCGFAQSLQLYALEDWKVPAIALAMQSMPKWRQGHVVTVLPLQMQQGVKHFLLDPTLRQFFNDAACRTPHRYGHAQPAGFYMAARLGGAELADELLTKGYAELTPARARIYAASFNAWAEPFPSAEAAFAHLIAPPANRYADQMNRWFPRAELAEKGLLLPRPGRRA